MNKKKILITGFSKFSGIENNPSESLVRHLKEEGWLIGEYDIRYVIFKTQYREVENEISNLLNTFNPDLIVSFGLNANAKGFEIERFARNFVSLEKLDDSGYSPETIVIDKFGADVIETSMNVESIHNALKNKGIMSAISMSAGNYVCNYLYYLTLTLKQHQISSIFVHIPLSNNDLIKIRPYMDNLNNLRWLTEKDLYSGAKLIIREALDQEGQLHDIAVNKKYTI